MTLLWLTLVRTYVVYIPNPTLSLIPATNRHVSMIPATNRHVSMIPATNRHVSLIPANICIYYEFTENIYFIFSSYAYIKNKSSINQT